MEAVRVPPSASMTSQSSQMVRSPMLVHVDGGAQGSPDETLDFQGASGTLCPWRTRAPFAWTWRAGSSRTPR